MSQETRDAARDQAEAWRETLTDLWARIDADDGQTLDGDAAREELDETPLEIVWEKGEPFAVVLGTGGPHTEIVGGGRQGGYQLWCYWGGERVAVTGASVTRTGDYFRTMMEEVYAD